MERKATRWGILGAGGISFDYVSALQILPNEEHQVTAVAARNIEKAQEFADKFGISKAYGSYEELAKDENVDIVYIGTIHPMHLASCELVLNSGKHVLCEKPLTMNSKQMKQVTQLARSKGLLLVEAFWSRHFPAWKAARKEIEAGAVGEIRMISVNFGLNIMDHERLHNKSLGGGVMLDLGCYGVMAVNEFIKEKPIKIIASGILIDTGVDEAAFITLHYPNRVICQINIHGGTVLNNSMVIAGTKTHLEVRNFWNSTEYVLNGKTHEFPLPQHSKHFKHVRSEGLVYEAQAIRESLIKGEKENPIVPLEDSETIMEILDEVRRQLGVQYDAD